MYKTTNMIMKNPIYLLSKNNATAVIPYIETREEFFYLDVFLKLLLGLLAIALIINKSGKGNLAPTSAMDQVQNYVLGGIIGGGDL